MAKTKQLFNVVNDSKFNKHFADLETQLMPFVELIQNERGFPVKVKVEEKKNETDRSHYDTETNEIVFKFHNEQDAEDVKWVVAHEFFHYIANNNTELRESTQDKEYYSLFEIFKKYFDIGEEEVHEVFHDFFPPEVFANAMASLVIGKFHKRHQFDKVEPYLKQKGISYKQHMEPGWEKHEKKVKMTDKLAKSVIEKLHLDIEDIPIKQIMKGVEYEVKKKGEDPTAYIAPIKDWLKHIKTVHSNLKKNANHYKELDTMKTIPTKEKLAEYKYMNLGPDQKKVSTDWIQKLKALVLNLKMDADIIEPAASGISIPYVEYEKFPYIIYIHPIYNKKTNAISNDILKVDFVPKKEMKLKRATDFLSFSWGMGRLRGYFAKKFKELGLAGSVDENSELNEVQPGSAVHLEKELKKMFEGVSDIIIMLKYRNANVPYIEIETPGPSGYEWYLNYGKQKEGWTIKFNTLVKKTFKSDYMFAGNKIIIDSPEYIRTRKEVRKYVRETVKKVKGGYKLYSKKTGRALSKKPKSLSGVQSQERAIQASKHARGG